VNWIQRGIAHAKKVFEFFCWCGAVLLAGAALIAVVAGLISAIFCKTAERVVERIYIPPQPVPGESIVPRPFIWQQVLPRAQNPAEQKFNEALDRFISGPRLEPRDGIRIPKAPNQHEWMDWCEWDEYRARHGY
jgi:hypothetical protein